ncbi:MAG: hypothetical protein IH919_10115, partial [Deltaproteobacteria bacterium]|nr:hypothetical protein [Deltaproteobacteria bacterium]
QRTQLLVDRTDSKFEPLSSDAHTLDGLDPHGNIIDEIHAHRTREVWDVLDTAMGARRQPMTWVITRCPSITCAGRRPPGPSGATARGTSHCPPC